MRKNTNKRFTNTSPFKTISEVLDYLERSNYLKYGVTIPTSVFEYLIGERFNDEWSWRGPYLFLKDLIEKEGFFCTQRGQAHHDLKILSPHEVAPHANKRQKKRQHHVRKDHHIVKKTDISVLDEEKRKIHLHELRRLSQAVLRLAEAMEDV